MSRPGKQGGREWRPHGKRSGRQAWGCPLDGRPLPRMILGGVTVGRDPPCSPCRVPPPLSAAAPRHFRGSRRPATAPGSPDSPPFRDGVSGPLLDGFTQQSFLTRNRLSLRRPVVKPDAPIPPADRA